MFIHVYIHVYIHAHMSIHMHIHMYVHISIHMYICGAIPCTALCQQITQSLASRYNDCACTHPWAHRDAAQTHKSKHAHAHPQLCAHLHCPSRSTSMPNLEVLRGSEVAVGKNMVQILG